MANPNKLVASARRKRSRTRKPGENSPKALGYEQFAWFPKVMLESPAFRALSINSYRLLFALWLEHLSHGGAENGHLIFTHEQLKAYGLTGSKIREAIDELEGFGFIRVKAGGRRALSNQPNRYRIAWLWAIDTDGMLVAPTSSWRNLSADDVKKWQLQKQTERKAKRAWRATSMSTRRAGSL